jgi:hypothetical protein
VVTLQVSPPCEGFKLAPEVKFAPSPEIDDRNGTVSMAAPFGKDGAGRDVVLGDDAFSLDANGKAIWSFSAGVLSIGRPLSVKLVFRVPRGSQDFCLSADRGVTWTSLEGKRGC